jgi:hypothetical protein
VRTVPHPCPDCHCGQEPPVRIDTAAPFFELVLLIDRFTYDHIDVADDKTDSRTQ